MVVGLAAGLDWSDVLTGTWAGKIGVEERRRKEGFSGNGSEVKS